MSVSNSHFAVCSKSRGTLNCDGSTQLVNAVGTPEFTHKRCLLSHVCLPASQLFGCSAPINSPLIL